jgi:hypothetical protein
MVPVTTARAVHASDAVACAGLAVGYGQACGGPVRWSLLAARLMPHEHPAGPSAADPGDLRP